MEKHGKEERSSQKERLCSLTEDTALCTRRRQHFREFRRGCQKAKTRQAVQWRRWWMGRWRERRRRRRTTTWGWRPTWWPRPRRRGWWKTTPRTLSSKVRRKPEPVFYVLFLSGALGVALAFLFLGQGGHLIRQEIISISVGFENVSGRNWTYICYIYDIHESW